MREWSVLPTMHGLSDYLNSRISLRSNGIQHFKLYGAMYVVIASSVIVIHLILSFDQPVVSLLGHATTVALGYTAGLALLEGVLLFFWRKQSPFNGTKIKTIWLISFFAFLLGYILLAPFKGLHYAELHPNWNMQESLGTLFRIFPIWFFMTFVFVQTHLKNSLAQEIAQLQEINMALERRVATVTQHPDTLSNPKHPYSSFVINKGNVSSEIDPRDISHISVDDHYCYVYVKKKGTYKKIEFQSSLQDAFEKLPKDLFIQVHRSHAINLSHLSSVKKIPRSYELIIGNNDFSIPVSRHRLPDVLPKLAEFLV
jgi:hypothetical protein